MKIFPTNFNPLSNSGPNSFTRNLFEQLGRECDVEIETNIKNSDIEFCLIQSDIKKSIPRITRLDGIYFNKSQDYNLLNDVILQTYNDSDAVIFQSKFNRDLVQRWFGEHRNGHVIINGADTEKINTINKADMSEMFDDRKIWMCASQWRPHKRLNENIRYFIEHSDDDDVLIIAGSGAMKEDFLGYEKLINVRIFYTGHVEWSQLISICKSASSFIHLSFLDHCPNVVVDAAACGCEIICASSGGTKEIYANNKTIVRDIDWDFMPIKLYEPPKLNFDNKKEIISKQSFNISNSALLYYNEMENIIETV
jgi:glycosyltransferase involved in cell wall biosynthesis